MKFLKRNVRAIGIEIAVIQQAEQSTFNIVLNLSYGKVSVNRVDRSYLSRFHGKVNVEESKKFKVRAKHEKTLSVRVTYLKRRIGSFSPSRKHF